MNLTSTAPSLRSLLLSLVFEQPGDRGLFPAGAADQDAALNIAYQELYAEIADRAPSAFAVRSPDTATIGSPAGQLPYATVDPRMALPYRVELKRQGGEYIPLDPVDDYNELNWQSLQSYGITEPTHYAILNFTIMVHPEPLQQVTLRVTYVPTPADLAQSTNETPFGGNLPQFHHLIAYRAALNVLTKDKAAERIQAVHDRGMGLLVKHLMRRQVQKSRMVRMTDREAI